MIIYYIKVKKIVTQVISEWIRDVTLLFKYLEAGEMSGQENDSSVQLRYCLLGFLSLKVFNSPQVSRFPQIDISSLLLDKWHLKRMLKFRELIEKGKGNKEAWQRSLGK